MELIERDGTHRHRLDEGQPDATVAEHRAPLLPTKAFRSRKKLDFELIQGGAPAFGWWATSGKPAARAAPGAVTED
jgi:hypothetical protein